MTALLQWDEQLFFLVNCEWHNALFDVLLPFLRNKFVWFPLYLFLLVFLLVNFGKKGGMVILALVIAVGLSDSISSHLIKKTVKRARPCHVFNSPQDMNLLVKCGSGYSFPSSHAANHFSIAVLLMLVLRAFSRWVKISLLVWAAAIAYSQVYVGLHYPLDVLAGAVLGSAVAWVVYRILMPCIDHASQRQGQPSTADNPADEG